ncbi:MAG: hypothetical protein Q8O55_12195 [Dehalococcoidales bacterium]|nr:hypothetical protein [Dehalococcoidales bacterium]
MDRYGITKGEGRTKVSLSVTYMGSVPVVSIYNENPHLGAVAVGEYDDKSGRTSVSVLTRLGHKDDAIAQKSAYLISKSIKGPSCVIAGIHLDDITEEEIGKFMDNADLLVNDFLNKK